MDITAVTLFSVFGLPVTAYALCLVISLGAGLLCFFLNGKKLALSQDALWHAALLALPLGLIGARLFYCVGNYFLYEEMGFSAARRIREGEDEAVLKKTVERSWKR